MNQEFYEKLTELLPKEEILCNEPMKKHTTFRIGGNADVFVSPCISKVPNILALAKSYEIPVTIIGNGSNLLVGDNGVRGLVLAFAKSAEEIQVNDNQMTIGAGTLLSKAAKEAATRGLSGLEFAAGIPGTLGGAMVMNAGAYGGEMKDIVVSAKVLTPQGDILELTPEELELSYRHSCIPEKKYIVLQATVRLTPKEESEIRAEMEDYKSRRIDKQPLEYPSAGSTFKRPEGYFAGKLIQDAGLRGYRVGGAQVSEKHCGFVINRGDATAKDVLQLIADVKEKVYEQFGVMLEPEVKMVGEF
ncbi:MAG: UDP-N-acetylmuramate dehydrogenase [Lachnospiraceae bacterium]|nr:UDP-N-acetylmuramate dehydrogenase [Lachnospiraceae bacterium]